MTTVEQQIKYHKEKLNKAQEKLDKIIIKIDLGEDRSSKIYKDYQ